MVARHQRVEDPLRQGGVPGGHAALTLQSRLQQHQLLLGLPQLPLQCGRSGLRGGR